MYRQVKLGVVISVVLVLAFMGYQLFNRTEEKPNPNLVNYKEPTLSQQDREFFQGKLDEARRLVAEIKPEATEGERFNLYVNLANSLYFLGYFKEAKDNYERALEIMPQDAGTWNLLSQNLVSMNDKMAALEAVKKAVALDLANPEYWKWQIAIEKELGASNERLNGVYVDAVVNSKNHLDMLVAYADFLEESGNLQSAKEYWQNAAAANPAQKAAYDQEIKRIDDKLNAAN